MGYLEFLRSVDGFESLSDDQLALCESFSKEKTFQQGEQLFKDGEAAGYLWVAKEGAIDLRFDLPGRETSEDNTILSIQAQRVFGWSSLMPPHKYRLSAYCASGLCRVEMIDTEKLMAFLLENPNIGYQVLSSVLRAVGRRFERLRDSADDAPFFKTG